MSCGVRIVSCDSTTPGKPVQGQCKVAAVSRPCTPRPPGKLLHSLPAPQPSTTNHRTPREASGGKIQISHALLQRWAKANLPKSGALLALLPISEILSSPS